MHFSKAELFYDFAFFWEETEWTTELLVNGE